MKLVLLLPMCLADSVSCPCLSCASEAGHQAHKGKGQGTESASTAHI